MDKIKRLFLFNPDCEMAIADGGNFYTPPKNVVRMVQDLAFLPAWLSKPGDGVLVYEQPDELFWKETCQPLQLTIQSVSIHELTANSAWTGEPWGKSPNMGHWLKTYGLGEAWHPEQKEWYSRKTAQKGLEVLLKTMPDLEIDILPRCCYSMEEIEKVISSGDFFIKAPWSSSGKGLLALSKKIGDKEREWIGGILRRQGYVMVEKRLDKVKDFAMEFQKGEKGCEFIGWSSFITGQQGEYRGNLLGSQEMIEQDLSNYLSTEVCMELKQKLPEMLNQLLPEYRGFLGVDMMIYRNQNGIHTLQPCLEINLRYNMGIIALFFSQRYLDPRVQGVFRVDYYAHPGEALKSIQHFRQVYPAKYKNNRLKAGYLNLTPVSETTHFVASVQCY